MRYLAPITMLILALAIMQPVEAQSFKPNYDVGFNAYRDEDYATALKHFLPLAKKGHAFAQQKLGYIYNNGEGVTVNYELAITWFRKSANQGLPTSQAQLGYMYRDSVGFLQDLVMSYVWFNVATTSYASGLKFLASKPRDEIYAKLTAPERKLALKLSKLCLKKPAKCPEYSDD